MKLMKDKGAAGVASCGFESGDGGWLCCCSWWRDGGGFGLVVSVVCEGVKGAAGGAIGEG